MGVRDTSLGLFTVNRGQRIQAATWGSGGYASSGMGAEELACWAAFSCHVSGAFWLATETSKRQWSHSTHCVNVLAKLIVWSADISSRAFVNQRCGLWEACWACCSTYRSKFVITKAEGLYWLQRWLSLDCIGINHKHHACEKQQLTVDFLNDHILF